MTTQLHMTTIVLPNIGTRSHRVFTGSLGSRPLRRLAPRRAAPALWSPEQVERMALAEIAAERRSSRRGALASMVILAVIVVGSLLLGGVAHAAPAKHHADDQTAAAKVELRHAKAKLATAKARAAKVKAEKRAAAARRKAWIAECVESWDGDDEDEATVRETCTAEAPTASFVAECVDERTGPTGGIPQGEALKLCTELAAQQ